MAIPVRPLAAVGFVWFLLGLFYYLFSSPTSAALSPAGLDEATTRPLPSTDAAASADYLEGALSLTPTTAVDSSDDPTLWRTFLQEPFVPREHRRLFSPVEILPDACLERWIAQGVPCSSEDLSEKDPKPLLDVDVVWTWVNGSDPRWAPLYTTHRNSTPASPEPPAARHYRSAKDELRHSVRSVMTYVFPRPRRLHLVLGDWQEGEEENTGAGNGESTTSIVLSRRRGQLPGWLALSLNDRTIIDEETGTEVVVHWHSNLFLGDGLRGEEAQRNYTRAALPTYNSFAIESNLYAIPGLSSSFAYFNDDFFLLRNHTRADFSSPIYGPVLRLSSPKSYLIPPFEFPAPGCEHEWNSLLRSSWLLSQRFPNKKRGYLQHIAKTLSQPLLLEARLIWEFQAVPSGTRRFRETSEGKLGDLNTAWLGSWLLVERARESLLWVWAVARLGGVDGLWGEEQRKEVREVLGMKDEDEGKNIKITKIKRDTVKTETIERAFQGLGEDGPRATKYLWSSLDGPLPGLEGGKPCTIAPVQCLGKWIEINSTEVISAEAMFKRIAFGGGGLCGDCILSAVIATSGTRGLSAILPPASAVAFAFPPAVKLGIKAQQKQFPHLERDLQPHMPLTPAWMTTDFSLASVVALVNPSDPHATVDLRTYALRLVARYQYTSAHTNALFSMIVNPTGFGGLVEQLETDPAIVSVGMNDDAEEQWAPALEPLVATYLGYRWPLKGWWERKGR